jgi:hypothetical protein
MQSIRKTVEKERGNLQENFCHYNILNLISETIIWQAVFIHKILLCFSYSLP